MNIIEYKLLYIAAIAATGLSAGLWPVLTGARANARFFSLGNAFGGGVFLGAGLLHLLPDAIDNYTPLLEPGWDYPLASLICAAGFLGVLLIDKVIAGADEDYLADAAAPRSSFAPYVLALILSVHSVIAGIALGVEDHFAASAALFIAIIAHKAAAAFALGASLHRGGVARGRSIRIVSLFSAMTPLGIAAGLSLGAVLTGRDVQWFEGTFDALAAGTFLYIAVVPIVGEEFAANEDIALKFAMVLLGLGVMALVAVWA